MTQNTSVTAHEQLMPLLAEFLKQNNAIGSAIKNLESPGKISEQERMCLTRQVMAAGRETRQILQRVGEMGIQKTVFMLHYRRFKKSKCA